MIFLDRKAKWIPSGPIKPLHMLIVQLRRPFKARRHASKIEGVPK